MEREYNTIESLVRQTSFIHWVYQSDADAIAYWERWLCEHPDKRYLMEEAVMVVKGIAFRKKEPDQPFIDAQWDLLEAKLRQKAPARFWRQPWRMAAAVVLLLLSAGCLWLLLQEPLVLQHTRFGETKNITLPDGSRVMLNANSTLSYHQDLMQQEIRKIYLEGEAFFEVVKKNAPQPVKFVVVTEDSEVEVLGTEFNVNSRRGKTRVALSSGSVQVHLENQQQAVLQPGEMMEYQQEAQQLHVQQVDISLHTAWKSQRLKFDDTSLTELAEILEDTYGLKVEIVDKRLLEEKITGEISAQNADVILKAIAKLFHIQISRKGNTVHLS